GGTAGLGGACAPARGGGAGTTPPTSSSPSRLPQGPCSPYRQGNKKPLVGAPPGEHGRHRLDEDRDVEPERPVLEVVEVEPHEVVVGQVAPAGDLPEAGHPGQHVRAPPVPRRELPVVADRQRA